MRSECPHRRVRSGLCQVVFSLSLCTALSASAQGNFNVVRTGGGKALVTVSQQLDSTPSLTPVVFFEFGFATDETVTPGQILDSFTVSLQGPTPSLTAILVTADASGFIWAPPTPMTLAISQASVAREPTAFPSLQPVPANRTAFRVAADIPGELRRRPLSIIFDLFDNQNPISSLAYFSVVAAVPEPSVWALLLGGALILVWGTRRKVR